VPEDLRDEFSEIPQLIKTYASQELIDPLRSVGRYLGFGIVGALLIALGIILLGLSGLRAMQTELSDTFDGNWSVMPYVIVIVVGIVVLGLIGLRTNKVLDDD
jgi:hypothetical protein